MQGRFAVLDLGSNTFHLLIVEADTSGFTEIYRKRIYTKLGKGGGQTILESSYKDGINALEQFRARLDEYRVQSYKAIGTAALRTADNGDKFLAEAKEKTGIRIELIDGKDEAGYIASGVVAATKFSTGSQWIMDIGGGSVEFILLENGKPIWMESFKVGLGILKARFHQKEPISIEEKEALVQFLDKELDPMLKRASDYTAIQLIGASGSFEVIQHILDLPQWNSHSYKCHVLDFHRVKEHILNLKVSDRLKVKGLPEERVDLIVVALCLMDFVIRKIGIEELMISDYALKEGIISAHYQNV